MEKEIVVVDEGVRVTLEDIGEGEDGEAREGEVTLLRFYVDRLNYRNEWEGVEDASYCTQVRSDAPQKKLEWVAKTILATVAAEVRRGESVKKLCERLSWISDTDAP